MTALAPERLTGVWWSKKCPRTACNGRGRGIGAVTPTRPARYRACPPLRIRPSVQSKNPTRRSIMSTEHRPSLNVIDGEALPEHTIVSEAYAHVAEGYRRALTIQGLPLVEVESLTASLRIALRVAGLPPVGRAV